MECKQKKRGQEQQQRRSRSKRKTHRHGNATKSQNTPRLTVHTTHEHIHMQIVPEVPFHPSLVRDYSTKNGEVSHSRGAGGIKVRDRSRRIGHVSSSVNLALSVLPLSCVTSWSPFLFSWRPYQACRYTMKSSTHAPFLEPCKLPLSPFCACCPTSFVTHSQVRRETPSTTHSKKCSNLY